MVPTWLWLQLRQPAWRPVGQGPHLGPGSTETSEQALDRSTSQLHALGYPPVEWHPSPSSSQQPPPVPGLGLVHISLVPSIHFAEDLLLSLSYQIFSQAPALFSEAQGEKSSLGVGVGRVSLGAQVIAFSTIFPIPAPTHVPFLPAFPAPCHQSGGGRGMFNSLVSVL